jgi:hypothetical protein
MTTEKQFNPYVWLVWGLPALVVVAGIITVIIAFKYADPLVSDDYYRDGLAINEDKAADTRASVLQISAHLERQGERLQITLHGQIIYPEQLQLTFEHPTQPQQDKSWVLKHYGNGIYANDGMQTLSNLQQGNWYINLSPLDKVWRLRATGNLVTHVQLNALP